VTNPGLTARGTTRRDRRNSCTEDGELLLPAKKKIYWLVEGQNLGEASKFNKKLQAQNIINYPRRKTELSVVCYVYSFYRTLSVFFSKLQSNTRLFLKNGVFWVVTPCGSCKNRRYGGTWRLLHHGDRNR
jgi:hypothetical protein